MFVTFLYAYTSVKYLSDTIDKFKVIYLSHSALPPHENKISTRKIRNVMIYNIQVFIILLQSFHFGS